MRKIFLSAIAMQPLQKCKYECEVYPICSETMFPITISLENNIEQGDNIVMLSLVTNSVGGNKAEDNYIKFKNQITEISKKVNINIEFVEIIVSDKIKSSTPRDLYNDIIQKFAKGDEIYADITYGFKYIPIVIFTALNYAYQTLEGVDIKEICYGNFYRGTNSPKAEYHDMTALFYMNSINGLAGMGLIQGDEITNTVNNPMIK